MANTLTQQEAIDAITKWVNAMNAGDTTYLKTWSPRAGITAADIAADAAAIKNKSDLQAYFVRGSLPGNKQAGIYGKNEVLGGEAVGGLKAGANLVKALLSRGGGKVAAEEAVSTGARGVVKKALSTKPRKIAAVAGATYGFNKLASNNKAGNTPDTTASQAETDLVTALNLAAQQGVDQSTVINGPIGKQLGLDNNSGAAIIAKYGGTADASIGGSIGVYTGPNKTTGKYVGSTFEGTTVSGLVSLGNWKKQFPIADAKAQMDFKNKLIDAGLPAASYQVPELQKAWEQLGQLSLDASRAGHNMTPWDMLGITKVLSSNASRPSVSYSINTSTPGEVRAYLDRQLETNLGRQATESEFKTFLKQVAAGEKKNPTKTVTTSSGGVSRSTTTGGYGAQDILAEADKFSQQSPDYAQRQTEMVFGDGLKKALGI